ncbi:MAG: hypothetical protein SGBAC_008266 [Bacillariaceae sp.]
MFRITQQKQKDPNQTEMETKQDDHDEEDDDVLEAFGISRAPSKESPRQYYTASENEDEDDFDGSTPPRQQSPREYHSASENEDDEGADILEAFGVSFPPKVSPREYLAASENEDDDADILEAFGINSPPEEGNPEEDHAESTDDTANDADILEAFGVITSPSKGNPSEYNAALKKEENGADILEAFGVSNSSDEDVTREPGTVLENDSDDADDADIFEAFDFSIPPKEEVARELKTVSEGEDDNDTDILEAFGVVSPPNEGAAKKSSVVAVPSSEFVYKEDKQDSISQSQRSIASQERRGSSLFQLFNSPSSRRRESDAMLEEEKRLKFEMVKDFVGEAVATPPVKLGSLIVDQQSMEAMRRFNLPEIPSSDGGSGAMEEVTSATSAGLPTSLPHKGEKILDGPLSPTTRDAIKENTKRDMDIDIDIDINTSRRSSLFGSMRGMFQGEHEANLASTSSADEESDRQHLHEEQGFDPQPELVDVLDQSLDEYEMMEEDSNTIQATEKQDDDIGPRRQSSVFGSLRNMLQGDREAVVSSSDTVDRHDCQLEGKETEQEHYDGVASIEKEEVKYAESISSAQEGEKQDGDIDSSRRSSVFGSLRGIFQGDRGIDSKSAADSISSSAQDDVAKKSDAQPNPTDAVETTNGKVETSSTVPQKGFLGGSARDSSVLPEVNEEITPTEPLDSPTAVEEKNKEDGQLDAMEQQKSLFGFLGLSQKESSALPQIRKETTPETEDAIPEQSSIQDKMAETESAIPTLFGLRFPKAVAQEEAEVVELVVPESELDKKDAELEVVSPQQGPPMFGLFRRGPKKEEAESKEVDPLELEKQKQEEILKLLWGDEEFKDQQLAQQNLIQSSKVQESEQPIAEAVEKLPPPDNADAPFKPEEPNQVQNPNILDGIGSLFRPKSLREEEETMPPRFDAKAGSTEHAASGGVMQEELMSSDLEETDIDENNPKGPRLGVFGSIFSPNRDKVLLSATQLETDDHPNNSDMKKQATKEAPGESLQPVVAEKPVISALEAEKERQQKLLMDLLSLDEMSVAKEQKKQALLISQRQSAKEEEAISTLRIGPLEAPEGTSFAVEEEDAGVPKTARFGVFGSLFVPDNSRTMDSPSGVAETMGDVNAAVDSIENTQDSLEASVRDSGNVSEATRRGQRVGVLGSIFNSNRGEVLLPETQLGEVQSSSDPDMPNTAIPAQTNEFPDPVVAEKDAKSALEIEKEVQQQLLIKVLSLDEMKEQQAQQAVFVSESLSAKQKQGESPNLDGDPALSEPDLYHVGQTNESPGPVVAVKDTKSALEIEKEIQQQLLMEMLSLDENAMKDQQAQQALLISESLSATLSTKQNTGEGSTVVDDSVPVEGIPALEDTTYRANRQSSTIQGLGNLFNQQTPLENNRIDEDEWESSLEPQSSDEQEDASPIVKSNPDHPDSVEKLPSRSSALAIEKQEKQRLVMKQLGIGEDQILMAQRAQEDLIRQSLHGEISPTVMGQFDPFLDPTPPHEDDENDEFAGDTILELDGIQKQETSPATQDDTVREQSSDDQVPQMAEGFSARNRSGIATASPGRVSLIQTMSSRFRPSARVDNHGDRLEMEKERQQRLLLEQLNLDAGDLQERRREQEDLIQKCVSERQQGNQVDMRTDVVEKKDAVACETDLDTRKANEAAESLDESKDEQDSHVLLWWRQKLRDKNDKDGTMVVPSEASVQSELVSDLGSTLDSQGSGEDPGVDGNNLPLELSYAHQSHNEANNSTAESEATTGSDEDKNHSTPTKSNVSPITSPEDKEASKEEVSDETSSKKGSKKEDIPMAAADNADTPMSNLGNKALKPQPRTTEIASPNGDNNSTGASFAGNNNDINDANESIDNQNVPIMISHKKTDSQRELDPGDDRTKASPAWSADSTENEGFTSSGNGCTGIEDATGGQETDGKGIDATNESGIVEDSKLSTDKLGLQTEQAEVETGRTKRCLKGFGTPTSLPDVFLRLPELDERRNVSPIFHESAKESAGLSIDSITKEDSVSSKSDCTFVEDSTGVHHSVISDGRSIPATVEAENLNEITAKKGSKKEDISMAAADNADTPMSNLENKALEPQPRTTEIASPKGDNNSTGARFAGRNNDINDANESINNQNVPIMISHKNDSQRELDPGDERTKESPAWSADGKGISATNETVIVEDSKLSTDKLGLQTEQVEIETGGPKRFQTAFGTPTSLPDAFLRLQELDVRQRDVEPLYENGPTLVEESLDLKKVQLGFGKLTSLPNNFLRLPDLGAQEAVQAKLRDHDSSSSQHSIAKDHPARDDRSLPLSHDAVDDKVSVREALFENDATSQPYESIEPDTYHVAVTSKDGDKGFGTHGKEKAEHFARGKAINAAVVEGHVASARDSIEGDIPTGDPVQEIADIVGCENRILSPVTKRDIPSSAEDSKEQQLDKEQENDATSQPYESIEPDTYHVAVTSKDGDKGFGTHGKEKAENFASGKAINAAVVEGHVASVRDSIEGDIPTGDPVQEIADIVDCENEILSPVTKRDIPSSAEDSKEQQLDKKQQERRSDQKRATIVAITNFATTWVEEDHDGDVSGDIHDSIYNSIEGGDTATLGNAVRDVSQLLEDDTLMASCAHRETTGEMKVGSEKENLEALPSLLRATGQQDDQLQSIDIVNDATKTGDIKLDPNIVERLPAIELQLEDNHLLVTIDGARVGGAFDISEIQDLKKRARLFADIQSKFPGIAISSSQGNQICIRLSLAGTMMGFKVENNKVSLLADPFTPQIQNTPWDQVEDESVGHVQSSTPEIESENQIPAPSNIDFSEKENATSFLNFDCDSPKAAAAARHSLQNDVNVSLQGIRAKQRMTGLRQKADPPVEQRIPFNPNESLHDGLSIGPFDETESLSIEQTIAPFDEMKSFNAKQLRQKNEGRIFMNEPEASRMEATNFNVDRTGRAKRNSKPLNRTSDPASYKSSGKTEMMKQSISSDKPDHGDLDGKKQNEDYLEQLDASPDTKMERDKISAVQLSLDDESRMESCRLPVQEELSERSKELPPLPKVRIASNLDAPGRSSSIGRDAENATESHVPMSEETGIAGSITKADDPSIGAKHSNPTKNESGYLARYIAARNKATARARNEIKTTLGAPSTRRKLDPSETKTRSSKKAGQPKTRTVDRQVFTLPAVVGTTEPQGIRISHKVKPRTAPGVVDDGRLSLEYTNASDRYATRRGRGRDLVPDPNSKKGGKPKSDRSRKHRGCYDGVSTYSSNSFQAARSDKNQLQPYIWNQRDSGWQEQQLGLGFGLGRPEMYHSAPGVFFYEDSANDKYSSYPKDRPDPRSRYTSPYLNDLSKKSYCRTALRAYVQNQRKLPTSRAKDTGAPITSSDRTFQRTRIKAKMQRLKTSISKVEDKAPTGHRI